MDKQLEKYYEDYFELFRSTAWGVLMEELKEQATRIDSVEYTKDIDDLFFRKGQLNVLAFLLNLEEYTKKSYEDALDLV